MAKRMLIDATHPEETRVVVHNGSRLEEFDYETVSKKQLKGNIYLAKITRVEPSLQAAFVEYGGNRHGFLPFSEIHPDYYRIPIADREALLAEEDSLKSSPTGDEDENGDGDEAENGAPESEGAEGTAELQASENGETDDGPEEGAESEAQSAEAAEASGEEAAEGEVAPADAQSANAQDAEEEDDTAVEQDDTVEEIEGETSVDTLSGEDDEEAAERSRAKLLRKYKIQEVIKRRQVILVQVAKEERGNKGAALTTYLSLAGRYCVLMPNTNKGGGISRKISNASDRRRLKEILSDLKIPEGIAVIVRTAGSQRNKTEIRRDYEYLMRLWNEIRELTLRSTAPALIHEEANLIKRAIRDLYSRDMEDVLVEGEASYKAAKSFMRTLMPSHAKKVQLYKDPSIPLFHRYKVEGQLDAMHNPTVQLRSGGYIVINPTEALVAVDVNSGKATRERHIEETALKTNLEAAEEVARQVRLRDLAGLVVIDFIDMEESRHNREVERRLKEAMKNDRARIQLGRISPFGLLEMSRQRLRPSLVENSTVICPTCHGVGTVRTTESTALHVLRAVEEEGIRRAGGRLLISVPTAVALYMLNQKRARLFDIEQRYGFEIEVAADDSLTAPDFGLDRLDEQGERISDQRAERSRDRGRDRQPARQRDDEDLRADFSDDSEDSGNERKRSRRRRRRKRDEDVAPVQAEENLSAADEEEASEALADAAFDEGEGEDEDSKSRKRRRRGKRGGRRRSRRRENGDMDLQEAAEADGESEEAMAEDSAAAAAADEEDDAVTAPGEEGNLESQSEEVNALPGSVEDAEAQAADVPLEAGEAEGAAPAAEEAPKPKRRRTRAPRRSEKAEPQETEAEAQANEAATSEEQAEDKPKRRPARSRAASTRSPRSRARKPAAAKEPAEEVKEEKATPPEPALAEAAQAQPEESEPLPLAADSTDPAETATLVAQESESPAAQIAPGAEPAAISESSGNDASDSEADSNEPKRRGWWSRWV